MTDCEVCGAPAESVATTRFTGVDYDGQDSTFLVDRIICAAGHSYHQVDDTETVK